MNILSNKKFLQSKRQSRAAQDFAMSELSSTLVLHFKTSKFFNDVAKINIKSEKLTPFGGIFHVMEVFDALLGKTIDSTLGVRSHLIGYQYSEIIRSLMSVYFCGGSSVEDVTTHLMPHLSLHTELRTCSSDTILRAIRELTCENTAYVSDSGKTYDFNIADRMNSLLLDVKAFGMKADSRIKAFVFRFISVPAKWIRRARQWTLNIYTDNYVYAMPFRDCST